MTLIDTILRAAACLPWLWVLASSWRVWRAMKSPTERRRARKTFFLMVTFYALTVAAIWWRP